MARHIDERDMWERVHANLYVLYRHVQWHASIYLSIYHTKQALEIETSLSITKTSPRLCAHFYISQTDLIDSDLDYEW